MKRTFIDNRTRLPRGALRNSLNPPRWVRESERHRSDSLRVAFSEARTMAVRARSLVEVSDAALVAAVFGRRLLRQFPDLAPDLVAALEAIAEAARWRRGTVTRPPELRPRKVLPFRRRPRGGATA